MQNTTVQKDEKKESDVVIDSLLPEVARLKLALSSFLVKIENESEYLDWPSMLDSYALLSGEISSLTKFLKSAKFSNGHNLGILPFMLSMEQDLELRKSTEERLQMFNHEVVPNYLRTKLEPKAEERFAEVARNARDCDVTPKQISNVNKICNSIIETVQNKREEFESELNQRSNLEPTSTGSETNALIAAAGFGRNLKVVPYPVSKRAESHMIGRSQAMQKSTSSMKGLGKGAAHPYVRS